MKRLDGRIRSARNLTEETNVIVVIVSLHDGNAGVDRQSQRLICDTFTWLNTVWFGGGGEYLPHLHSLDGRSRNVCLGLFRTRNPDYSTVLAARRNGPHGVATRSVRAVLVGVATVAFLATESNVNSDTRAGLLRPYNSLGCLKVGGQHAERMRVPVLDASPHLPLL